MVAYTLPFRSNSSYSFTANAGGNNFRIHIKHNLRNDTYYMDVDISRNGNYENIIRSINITCGMDLFFPYQYYGLGTLYVIPTDSRYYDKVPKAETITRYFQLLWSHD